MLKVALAILSVLVVVLFILVIVSRSVNIQRAQLLASTKPNIEFKQWRYDLRLLPVTRLFDSLCSPTSNTTIVEGIKIKSLDGVSDFAECSSLLPEVQYLEIHASMGSERFARIANEFRELKEIYVHDGFLDEATLKILGDHPSSPTIIFELCDFDSVDFDGKYVSRANELGTRCVKHYRHR